MSILEKLRRKRSGIADQIDGLAALEEMTDEQLRTSLTLLDQRRDLDAQIEQLESEERAVRDAEAQRRSDVIADAHRGEAGSEEERGAAVVTREERTYSEGASRRGVSFIRDVMQSTRNPDAAARLGRHMQEERVDRGGEIQHRDGSTSNYAGLVVPQYLVDMAAPKARAMRPFADICTHLELPDDGNTVNISRITTGSTTAVQASENASVSETDIDDTLLTVNVRTIAGQQDLSRQAIDRGTGVDALAVRDLIAAYHTTLDNGILNDDGTSGTHLGLRSTSSIVAVTYTDASPTSAEAYPKLWDLIQQVQSGVFLGVSHFVMHPRRWAWFAAAVGSNFPFLQVNKIVQQAGAVASREYGGVVGDIAGVPVIVDGNMVTNLGAGTNEDVVIGVTSEELFLWEDSGAPMFIRADETAAGNLTCKFVIWGYSAFTAGRYPGAHGTIGGTGFVTPTF